MGVPAYGIENIEALLEYKIDKINPDIVFIAILWPFYDPKNYDFIKHKELMKRKIPKRFHGITINSNPNVIGSIDSPINKANNVPEPRDITILNLNKKINIDGLIKKFEVIIPKNGFKKANLKLKVFRRSKSIFNSSVNHFKEIGSSELLNYNQGFIN